MELIIANYVPIIPAIFTSCKYYCVNSISNFTEAHKMFHTDLGCHVVCTIGNKLRCQEADTNIWISQFYDWHKI